jgi:hypothetical protein
VSFGPKQSDIAPGFFRRLPAWALTFIDEEGFECIGKERTEAGPTTTCYQSPLDASIEAVYLGKFYRPHRVNVACEFDIGAFLDERGHSLVAAMHIGWPAHDGRLLLHPDGRLGRTCRLMRQSLGVPPTFEIDGPTLDAYHCWRERAGLFAWAETVRDVRAWPLTWLHHVATKAVAMIQTQRVSDHWKNATQLAIFDPEFGQWHFVPFPSSDKGL